MSVKCCTFFSEILRKKGRLWWFPLFYPSEKIVWKTPVHSQVFYVETFHRNKKILFTEQDLKGETNKKIQLTKFKVTDNEEGGVGICDEDSDEDSSLDQFLVKQEGVTNDRVDDKQEHVRKVNDCIIEKKENTKYTLEAGEVREVRNVRQEEGVEKYLSTWIHLKGRERSVKWGSSNNALLNQELMNLEVSLRPSASDVNNTKQFLYFLQNEINKQYANCHVTPFGSVINGFWTKNSDVDICIQVPVLLNRKDQIKFLKKICIILNAYKGGIIEQRFSAKVPIIHFSFTNEKNCFALSCDISINNILAIVNSKLIQQYVHVDKRLQLMGIALKYWSKNRNINDRSKGFLSSFSLILMIIHFLQNVADPKILPSLQDISFERNEKPYYVLGVDCKYCKDEKIIKEKLYQVNNCRNADTDIGTLVIQFFKFYGYQYKSGVIAIRDITNYYQNFQSLKDFESYFLFVDNPFEVGKNVANILPQNYKTIINEMKRAYRILKANGTWQDVCQSNDNVCSFH